MQQHAALCWQASNTESLPSFRLRTSRAPAGSGQSPRSGTGVRSGKDGLRLEMFLGSLKGSVQKCDMNQSTIPEHAT